MREYNDKQHESKKLSPQDKDQLCRLWLDVVLPEGAKAPDISTMDNEAINNWLAQSIREQIALIAVEAGLEGGDEELIVEIELAQTQNEKAEKEWLYIQKKMADFADFKKSENRQKQSDLHFTPRDLKNNIQPDCVSGTLIGMELLDRAGIKNYFGNPVGHALNIVELANGNWCYVDFTDKRLLPLKPEFVEIEGVSVLVVNDERFPYQLIPLLTNTDIGAPILSNLQEIENSAELDFNSLLKNLFPNIWRLKNSAEMEKERERHKQWRENRNRKINS